MQAKLEEEKEAVEFVKEHGTNSDEENAGEKSRSKEQKLYLKLEHKAKERYWFNLKSLMIHGNGLLSLLLVRSMLMPRHVRFTMLFTNILLQFFWCAVIIKNSQQALLLPDKVIFSFIIYHIELHYTFRHCSEQSLSINYGTFWNKYSDVCLRWSLQDIWCKNQQLLYHGLPWTDAVIYRKIINIIVWSLRRKWRWDSLSHTRSPSQYMRPYYGTSSSSLRRTGGVYLGYGGMRVSSLW